MVCAMITGVASAPSDETMMAVNAMASRRPSCCISGSRRESAFQPESRFWLAVERLSLYFIVFRALLRTVDLNVFRRSVHQLGIRAKRQHLALHQENDLVVVLDRGNLLGHRDERHFRIIAAHIAEDLALGALV